MDRQEFGRAFLREFLHGERDAPPDSWVYRENWLTWHHGVGLPSGMVAKEIEKAVARATGKGAQPWAWESLTRLYNACREREEPLPAPLQSWVDDVVNGRVSRPIRRGRKPDSDKHSRYAIAFAVLTGPFGYTWEQAIVEMAGATNQPEDTIHSLLGRTRRGS